MLRVAPLLAPPRRARSPEAVDGGVVGLAVPIPIADRRSRRVPLRSAHRREGDVTDRVAHEAPGQIPVLGRRSNGGDAGPEIGLGQDVHHRVALRGTPITLQDRRRQNLFQILRLARRHHHPPLRHFDRHVVAAKPEVELGVTEKLVRLPALNVVVHRHLRVPVGDVEKVVFAPAHAPAGAALWDLEGPIDLQHHRVAGGQEPARPHEHRCALDPVPETSP